MLNKNRRYYLHKLLKKSGISYSVKLKTIYIPFNEIEKANNKAVLGLKLEFNYSVQLIIV